MRFTLNTLGAPANASTILGNVATDISQISNARQDASDAATRESGAPTTACKVARPNASEECPI
jgi:hypothetical protein